MQTYKFRCTDCGAVFEKCLHFNDDRAGISCPKCKSLKLQRIYSAPAVVFKGQGFYVNDSRSKATSHAGTSTT